MILSLFSYIVSHNCGSNRKVKSSVKNPLESEHSSLDPSLCNELGPDLLQDSFRLAIWQIVGLVVAGCDFDEPLDLYVGDGAHVVLRGQHELVVEHPVGLEFVLELKSQINTHLMIETS